MSNHFDEFNFVRLVIPFGLGIASYVYFAFQLPYLLFFISFTFILLLLLHLVKAIRIHFWGGVLFGISLNLLLFACGNYLVCKVDASNHPDYLAQQTNNADYLIVQIDKPFVKKSKYFKSVATIHATSVNESNKLLQQKLYLNLKNINSVNLPKYGDILIIKNKAFEIEAPKNPGAFNYKRFSKLKQIYFQSYLQADEFSVICSDCGSSLWKNIFLLRDKLMHQLKTHINDKTVLAIASALLLGQKDYLTPDIQEVYADTGAMHILAVSGLHVGILLMVLSFLFKPLVHIKYGKALKALLIILLIWLYAGITGFAPSVTRAALMFSLYLVADVLNRNKNIYNVLAASAFLILLFKPNMIAEVGFQLSYAAVFSIVWLYPYIYKTFFFSNGVIDFFWSISAVSIAAQIGTFPISLYYFHQFPLTFFAANLVAIPSATVIFIGGVALLSAAFISTKLATFVGLFLEGVIQTLNFALGKLEQLPFSTLEFNQVSFYVPFLIALLSISIILWFLHEKRSALFSASLSLLLLCSSYCWHTFQSYSQKKMLVYHHYKQAPVSFLNGKTTQLFNKNIIKSRTMQRFVIEPANRYFGAKPIESPSQEERFFLIGSKSLLIIDTTFRNHQKQYIAFETDIVMLSGNPYVNLEQLKNSIKFKQLVFAGNNSSTKIKYWNKQCVSLGLNCYDMADEGAFVYNID